MRHLPITIGVKTSNDTLAFYDVVNGRVKSSYQVSMGSDGDKVCTCPISKFRAYEGKAGACPHVEWVAPASTLITSGRKQEEWTIDWVNDDPGTWLFIDYTQSDTCGVVSAHLADINVDELVAFLAGDKEKIKKGKAGAYLTPDKIESQLSKADETGNTIYSPEVLEAGKGVDVISSVDGDESSVDESLTEGDYLADHEEVEKDLSGKPWKTIKRPSPDKFFVTQEVWEQGLRALARGKNILLTGPSGWAKPNCYIL